MAVSGNPARSSSACRLHGEVGEVAGVEADADRLVPGAPEPLERGDGVRQATAEGVDGVDEEQGVVGVDVGVGIERRPLALPQGDEQLDHRVGVGPGRDPPEAVGDGTVGRRVGATDERRPGRRIGPLRGGAAHPELEHGPALRGLGDAGRLGGDERGEVELVEQRGLQHLGGGQRSFDGGDRGVGVHDTTLRHRVDAQGTEVEVGEPGAERVVEQALAATAAMAAQGRDVDRSGVDGGRPRGERSEAGRHAVAGLVVAVVGVAAEEVLEAHPAVLHARAEVQLGHRQLVGVGAEDAAPQRPGSHGRTLRPSAPSFVATLRTRSGTRGEQPAVAYVRVHQ